MVLHSIPKINSLFGCHVFPASYCADYFCVPEISVHKRWWFPPALIGLWLKETVVNMDRVRQVQPALLVT